MLTQEMVTKVRDTWPVQPKFGNLLPAQGIWYPEWVKGPWGKAQTAAFLMQLTIVLFTLSQLLHLGVKTKATWCSEPQFCIRLISKIVWRMSLKLGGAIMVDKRWTKNKCLLLLMHWNFISKFLSFLKFIGNIHCATQFIIHKSAC